MMKYEVICRKYNEWEGDKVVSVDTPDRVVLAQFEDEDKAWEWLNKYIDDNAEDMDVYCALGTYYDYMDNAYVVEEVDEIEDD